MQVKIGDKITDSDNEPIMIILEPFEKQYISDMGPQLSVCFFPTDCVIQDIKNFMEVPS